MPPAKACPLPRWPALMGALRTRGLRVHHLAAELGQSPSIVFAWVYGHEDMPVEQRRAAERFLDMEPGSLG